MKVRFGPVLLSLTALAACARANPPQGVGTNTSTGDPAPSAHSSQAPAPGSGPTSGSISGPISGPATPDSHCPSQTPLDPGADAKTAATAVAEAAVPKRYPPHIDIAGFRVTDAYAADPALGYGAIAYGLCGQVVGQRTWVVELSFPKMAPSVDLSAGQLFLSRFPDGWKVWFQYH
jgi:hypothetical protein